MRPLLLLVVLVLVPNRAEAWGHDVHRFIMDRAIALLPVELRPLFEVNRVMVAERSVDPDTWRTVGFKEEDKNHFIDLDWGGYGPYPFRELPRDLDAAVRKFGRAQIEQYGTLPWRIEEFHGHLRRAFEAYRRPTAVSRFNVLLFSGALSHYVADSLVPFHAVVNYDGQLTGQTGIHSRFETFLFERYRDRIRVTPMPVAPILNPRDFTFDRVLEGTQLASGILKSDLQAIGTRDIYDDMYYDAFFAANRAVLERRLSEAAAAVAGMITGAWQAAGRPSVPVDLPPPTPQRRR